MEIFDFGLGHMKHYVAINNEKWLDHSRKIFDWGIDWRKFGKPVGWTECGYGAQLITQLLVVHLATHCERENTYIMFLNCSSQFSVPKWKKIALLFFFSFVLKIRRTSWKTPSICFLFSERPAKEEAPLKGNHGTERQDWHIGSKRRKRRWSWSFWPWPGGDHLRQIITCFYSS